MSKKILETFYGLREAPLKNQVSKKCRKENAPMKNKVERLKKLNVALTPCELENIDDVKERFHDGMDWKISRHQLLKMAIQRGLREIRKSYEFHKSVEI